MFAKLNNLTTITTDKLSKLKTLTSGLYQLGTVVDHELVNKNEYSAIKKLKKVINNHDPWSITMYTLRVTLPNKVNW